MTLLLFSGLSIQPISESVSHLDGIIKEVESAYKILQEACKDVSSLLKDYSLNFMFVQAKQLSQNEGIGKAKERISEGLKIAKSKLGNAETKM